ncbi:MAG: RNA polymerase sigma factor RpoD/SigA [Candidatus Omnitrophica bacterium]|nr:RNA polymerase sigma factor RpoD/SigA [Candidatus Omnitrophota bacterium]
MDSIKAYLRDIKDIPLLSPQQEIELSKRAKKGDKLARDQLIRSNLRLVINIAKRYMHFGIPLIDLIEEGNMGLMRAVDKFNPSKGFRFSTYAAWWIRQSITRAIFEQQKVIRMPIYINELINRWKKTQEKLSHKLKRIPTNEEIAKKMGLSKAKMEELVSWLSSTTLSLEAPVGEDEESQVKDLVEDKTVVSPDKEISRFLDRERIDNLLEKMTPRERQILDMRFGIMDGNIYTLAQIAKKFGISRERVRQIEEQALKKLRKFVKEQEEKELK